MHYKYVSTLLAIIIFNCLITYSCTKNETPANCFGDLIVDTSALECSTTTSYPCRIPLKGQFRLSDKSKKILLAMCQPQGSIISFQNEAGAIIDFTIDGKYNAEVQAEYYSDIICDKKNTQLISYCGKMETMGIQFSNEKLNFAIWISLSTEPDVSSTIAGKEGDILTVLRGEPNFFSWENELRIVIDQKTLTYDKTEDQEFFSSIKLGTKTFKNVHSMDISNFAGNLYKHYLNDEIGLIGFEDEDNVLWLRK